MYSGLTEAVTGLPAVDALSGIEMDEGKLTWIVVVSVCVTTIVSVRKVKALASVEVRVRVFVTVKVASVVETPTGIGIMNSVPGKSVNLLKASRVVHNATY
jgi:hypothetical protein